MVALLNKYFSRNQEHEWRNHRKVAQMKTNYWLFCTDLNCEEFLFDSKKLIGSVKYSNKSKLNDRSSKIEVHLHKSRGCLFMLLYGLKLDVVKRA